MSQDTTTTPSQPVASPAQPSLWHLLIHNRVLRLVVGLLALWYALVWIYKFLEGLIGPFAPLLSFLLSALGLSVVVPWLLIHYRTPLGRATVVVTSWIKKALHSTGLPQYCTTKYPSLIRFLGARFARNTVTGFGLTFALLFAGILGWYFVQLSGAVVTGGNLLVANDHRIVNLLATLRTPKLDGLMLALSFLGNAQTIVVLASIVVAIALLRRLWGAAILIIFSIVASSLFFVIVTHLVERTRPPLETARLIQGGFSFPSGHAAIAATFYGTVAYLLMRTTKQGRDILEVFYALIATFIVLGIGVSRMYLGVHYPSDVLAGWVGGTLWLVLIIVAEQLVGAIVTRRRKTNKGASVVAKLQSRLVLNLLTTAIISIGLVYLGSNYKQITSDESVPVVQATPAKLVNSADLPASLLASLPQHTESLFGLPQEPVCLIFVGTRAEVEKAFKDANWYEARPQGIGSLRKAIASTLSNAPDPTGPVTPVFMAEQPNKLAFSQPVGKSFAQRHHTRLWLSPVRLAETNQPVWVATASYDQGFEIAKNLLPTHRIAPDIDTERAFITTSLQQPTNSSVLKTQEMQWAAPELGHNFNGDPFFTYGKAVIIWLRPQS